MVFNVKSSESKKFSMIIGVSIDDIFKSMGKDILIRSSYTEHKISSHCHLTVLNYTLGAQFRLLPIIFHL